MEFQIALEAYLQDLEVRGLRHKTWRRYRDDLLLMQSFLKAIGVSDLESITAHSVRRFFEDLKQRNNIYRDGQLLSDSTIDGRRRSALTFLRWCEKKGWLSLMRHLNEEEKEIQIVTNR